MAYIHHVQIYYEDTDHSGLVYHPNYLKYFERAREHMLGREALVRLWEDEGIGFVVYRADQRFKEGARFGDILEVRSTAKLESSYRIVFDQQIWKADGRAAMVEATIEMVCVTKDNKLVPIPESVLRLADHTG